MGKRARSFVARLILWHGPGKGEEGFSLPELLVAVLILSMLVLATFQLLDAQLGESGVVIARSDIAEDLRMAMDTMVDQLRTARTFHNAGANDMTFTGYVLGSATQQTVRFFLSGDALYMNCPALFSGDKLVVAGVSGLIFRYYSAAGTLLTNPNQSLASIALVEIELTISRTSGKVKQEETAKTQVRVRR
ncbi:prepilin-type N-terminal cleavage/methylation domain-containing protein [Candidatus Solincola tengchongensis]|uniref:PulJ/GspJ family protein n=1 Tax=Candidatus Solincola tengchongensis TaxID=2900693 RepID=UPI00257E6903|nr:prepilin-type N-terminal cleavage/methylation domain-containing protein [Candidatus Solincola tengchongensis]